MPPEVNLTANERNFLRQNVEITHKGMRRIIASMAKFLGVWDIICPDFLSLIKRYCQELGLPSMNILFNYNMYNIYIYNFDIYFYIFDFFALPVCLYFLNINLMLYI